jgi:hypothetical protein
MVSHELLARPCPQAGKFHFTSIFSLTKPSSKKKKKKKKPLTEKKPGVETTKDNKQRQKQQKGAKHYLPISSNC